MNEKNNIRDFIHHEIYGLSIPTWPNGDPDYSGLADSITDWISGFHEKTIINLLTEILVKAQQTDDARQIRHLIKDRILKIYE